MPEPTASSAAPLNDPRPVVSSARVADSGPPVPGTFDAATSPLTNLYLSLHSADPGGPAPLRDQLDKLAEGYRTALADAIRPCAFCGEPARPGSIVCAKYPNHATVFESYLPPCDLPRRRSVAEPKVGELWALGMQGRHLVLRIEKVDTLNPIVMATVLAAHSARPTAGTAPVGSLTELVDGLWHMRHICDAGADPTVTPAELYADLVPAPPVTSPAPAVNPGANPACGCSLDHPCAAHQNLPAYEPPTVTPIEKTRTLVSMNGRDWLNLAQLDDAAEPLNRYPHWQIWRGDELLIFHPSPPAEAPTCGATSEDSPSGLCGALATHRPNRCGTPLCDRCYLAHERQISHWTARDPAHWSARLRMDLMAYNERGWGRMDGPEPVRPCTPTAWGGIFDPQADR